MKSAIVVGAGLSGLTAAYRLKQNGFNVTVLEASGKLGGRSQTEHIDGFKIDTGASMMSNGYTAYLKLAEELGMADSVVATSQKIAIPRNGKLHEIDLASVVKSLLATKLLSWKARFRLLPAVIDAYSAKRRGELDYDCMASAAPLDTESVQDYAQRRLDQESYDYFCTPLVRLMTLADSADVSKVELLSGIGNIIGLKMLSLMGGVNAMSQRLARDLDVRLESPATLVDESEQGVRVSWRDTDGKDQQQEADACVVACRLPEAVDICRFHAAALKEFGNSLGYTTAITVAVATSERPDTDAMVMMLPEEESADIGLMFFDHNKCPDRAPDGHYLTNCQWQTNASVAHYDAGDEELVEKSLAVFRNYFPAAADAVVLTHVQRWPMALPYSRTGMFKASRRFLDTVDPGARIQFTGDYRSVAGQNTAVSFGELAANNIIKASQNNHTP